MRRATAPRPNQSRAQRPENALIVRRSRHDDPLVGVVRERDVGCDRCLAGRAAKDLPAELKAMAREGMDMIMLQECGVHESGGKPSGEQ